jgi:hypothetical protein
MKQYVCNTKNEKCSRACPHAYPHEPMKEPSPRSNPTCTSVGYCPWVKSDVKCVPTRESDNE